MPTALITGSGIKIGQDIALALAKSGYDIIAHGYSSKKDTYNTKILIENCNRKCKIFFTNLSSNIKRLEFINKIKNTYNSLDVLINNAALFKQKKFENITLNEYNKIFNLNIKAPFFLIQGLLPLLKKGKNPCIINITDTMINRPYSNYAHYFSSKGALTTLTKVLANELAPGIRVNAIAPGLISFPNNYKSSKKTQILNKIPLKKIGKSSDIAKAVVYLSCNALYSTGQTIYIDGGKNNAS